MADYSTLIDQAGQKWNVDPRLISSVIGVESSGNPNAVGPNTKYGNASGLGQFIPATAKSLGITDPTDPNQAIPAVAQLLSQNLDRYQDPAKAIMAYHGGTDQANWGPKTQAYLQKVQSAYQGQGQPMAQPAQMPGLPPTADAAQASDPFSALLSKAGGATAAPSGGGAPAADPFSALMAKAASPATSSKQATQPTQQLHESTPLDALGAAFEPVATLATGALAAPIGGIARLASAALGSSYEDAKSTGNKITDALTYHPQTQGGQQALAGLGDMATGAKNAVMSSPVGPAISAVGNAYNNTFVKGQNPLMATINDQVPSVIGNVIAARAGSAIMDGTASNALKQAIAKPSASAERVEPTIGAAQTAPVGNSGFRDAGRPSSTMYTGADGTTSAKPPETSTGSAAGAATNASGQGSTLVGVGAASSDLNPYAGLTGEETARGGSSSFPQVKVAKNSGDVPDAEQAVRAQIANEILGPDNDAVRTGVVTGNEDTLRGEYTLAKNPDNTPAQIALRDQIAREQQALSTYAQARIDATGANPSLINNEQRGQMINDAIHGDGGLNDYFQQAKQQIYDQARQESGDNPIQTSHVDALLNDPQFQAEAERSGNSRVVSGVTRMIDLARNTGFRDPFSGEVTSPGSVAAWDAVRKSNNADWNENNARTLSSINRAIDQDIASAAGSDAYKLGDAIHQAQQNITGARGFKQVFGNADSNGVKSGVALEQIPTRLNNMPLDQWRHVYNTLDDLSRGQISGAPSGMPPVPQELQQMAAAAKNEVSGSLAREVYEQGAGKAGTWNQNSVNKTLNSVVGQKILETYPPDEVQRFHALNYGGQIMPGVHSYEGAALQKARVDNPGFIEKYGPGGAYVAGASVGGPVGGWAAEKVANKLTTKMKGGRLSSQGNQLLDAMRANSSLGSK